MQKNVIFIGRIAGIPIGLDYSWFLIFVLLTWTLASDYYPSQYSGWSANLYWLMGTITSVTLFLSVLLHELGHSLVALLYNIPVYRIRLMFFGGVAELGDEPPSAGSEFWVALAGPAVSVLVAVGTGLGWLVLRPFVDDRTPLEALLALVSYISLLNLSLVGFNMIPGFPLDGGRVFRAIIWSLTQDRLRATQIAGGVGRFIAFGFVGFGILSVIFGRIGNGVWLIVIGWFLQNAARSETYIARVRRVLEGRMVSHLLLYAHGYMRPLFVTDFYIKTDSLNNNFVGPETPVWDALRKMQQLNLHQLPVVLEGRFLGMIRTEDIWRYATTLLQAQQKGLLQT